jgi:cytidylate kinase
VKIVIVGPCASGKSTLADLLRSAGFDAHACAQEHSYVPDMWRMTGPDWLIYLDAGLEAIRRRRDEHWPLAQLERENERLQHARQHCELYIVTDELSIDEVRERALEFLRPAAAATARAPRSSRPPAD